MKTSPKNNRLSPLALLLALALAGSVLVTANLQAATQTWKVNNGGWEAAANWNTAVPAAGDSVILTAASGTRAVTISNTNGTAAIQSLTTSNNFAWIVRSNTLNFTNNATITSGTGGSASLTIDSVLHASGNLTVTGIKNVFSSSSNTIGGELILDGSSRLYLTGGAGSAGGASTIRFTGNSHKYLYLNGDTYTNNLALDGSGGNLTIIEVNTNGGTITLAGNISGGTNGMGDFSVGIAKDDTTYVLSGTNTYEANTLIGATDATNTTIRITKDNAFGTSSASKNVTFRAGTNQTLELVGGIAVSNRTLYLGGTGQGVSNKGGLQTISGNNAWNGNIVLNTATNGVGSGWIGTAAGSSLLVSGVISSSNGITKLGAGTLILSGANTYSGGTLIDAGTLSVGNGDASGTLGSGNVTNNATLQVNRTNTYTLANVISGSGGTLQQLGTGTTVLTGNNTYSGGTRIDAGALSVGNGGTSGTLGDSSITNNAILQVNRSDTYTLTNAISGTAGTFQQLGSGTTKLDGIISYTGDLTFMGTGIELNNTGNTIGGDLILNVARIKLAGPDALGGANAIKFQGSSHNFLYVSEGTYSNNVILTNTSGTMQFDAYNITNKTITLSGQISGVAGGSATFNVGSSTEDGGTYVISGNNSYEADTVLGAVGATNTTIRITTDSAFGTSSASKTVTFRAGTNQTLELAGGIAVSNRTLYLGGTGQGVSNKGGLQTISGDNAWNGNIVLDTATNGVGSGWIGTAAGSSLHVSGVVSSSNGITKLGTGTLILSASNTFTGATTVSEGTLQLNTTTSLGGALAQSTSVTVASGATLLISKSHQINNSATVTLSGGTIQRGSSVNETLGNLNLTTDSFLDYGIGTTGTLRFGTYTDTPSSLLTVNNFLEGNILIFGSDLTLTISNSSYFAFDHGFTSSWDSGAGLFTITAIPEPSTVAAALGLTGLLLWPSRRRLIKDAKSILGLRRSARERLSKL